MFSRKEKGGQPFKELKPLKGIEKGVFFEIKEVVNNPKFIVKEESRLTGEPWSRVSSEWAKTSQEIVNNYLAPLDITPKQQFVFAQGEDGKKKFFIISERINGVNLGKNPRPVIDHKEEFEEFINKTLEAAFKAYQEGRYFMPGDFCLKNMIFGQNANNNKGERFYLVDVYPGLQQLSKDAVEAMLKRKTFAKKLFLNLQDACSSQRGVFKDEAESQTVQKEFALMEQKLNVRIDKFLKEKTS